MKMQILFFFNFLFFLISCGNAGKKQEAFNASEIGYNIATPDKTLYLSSELDEVSDISFLSNGHIACIQDELGTIYEIDPSDGKIISQKKFSGPGDFEGLTIVGSTAYAVTSGGRIFEITDYDQESQKVKEYDTFLNEENNVEGACFDKISGNILLACKGQPGAGMDRRDYKTVYAYNLKTHALLEEPFIKISLKKLKKFVEKQSGKPGKKASFNPSGMAIHPITGHYFIIASAGKLLLELDKQFSIIHEVDLPDNIFIQPEGITFDPDGGLYIANEGKGGEASILYFKKL